MSRVVIVAAGGKGTRWNDYMGVPKFEAQVDGVRIIDRIQLQIKSHEETAIIIKDGPRKYGDLDKIYSSHKNWNRDGRTIILFGDTYYTNEAMEKIMAYPEPDWTVFGRVGPSEITGKGYGELFAFSFYPEHIEKIMRGMNRVKKLEERGVVHSANLWALYRAMQNFPDDLMDRHFAGDNFIEINDFTEDFDWPQDYDQFIERYKS
jgi:hypothetical protein